jgi:DNA-binding transcriptional LysR family regulator
VMDRVTVAEAADRLGVTHDALRKRIKRGSIEWEANRWS